MVAQGPIRLPISHRTKRIKKRCRLISTSRKRTLQLSNQWWPPRPMEETTLLLARRPTGQEPQGKTSFIPDRKKAVHKTLGQRSALTRNQNNQIMVVKAWAKPQQEAHRRWIQGMRQWLASSRQLYSRNSRSVKHLSQLEAQSLAEARTWIMG